MQTNDAFRAEVSSAVCFLLSDGARYITGVSIDVSGGSHLVHDPANGKDHAGWPKYDEHKL